MLEPIISDRRSLALIVLGMACFYLGYVIYNNKKYSIYPNVFAAIVCIGTGLWILDSTIVDRVTVDSIYLFSGKLTYIIPYFSLYFFYLFIRDFPSRKNKIYKTWSRISLVIVILLSVIVLHPNNYAISIAENGAQIIPSSNLPIYYCLMAGFAFLILLIISEAIIKWRYLNSRDKVNLKIILIGIVLSFIPAAIFSVINAIYINNSSYYQYAYPPIIIFISLFAYVIIKNGAFDTSVTFSRKGIVSVAIVITMLTVLILIIT